MPHKDSKINRNEFFMDERLGVLDPAVTDHKAVFNSEKKRGNCLVFILFPDVVKKTAVAFNAPMLQFRCNDVVD